MAEPMIEIMSDGSGDGRAHDMKKEAIRYLGLSIQGESRHDIIS